MATAGIRPGQLWSSVPKSCWSSSRTSTRPFSHQSTATQRTIRSSRDHPRPRNSDDQTTGSLRKDVMDEVAIPGRYQMYFKKSRRGLTDDFKADPTRTTKKVAAAHWRNPEGRDSAHKDADSLSDWADSSPSDTGRSRGFENVATRALEQIYAQGALPHPYFQQDYLEIAKTRLLEDRKTFQLWYRPKPQDNISSDDIAEVVNRHAPAFKAMLARYAKNMTASRLKFQLLRQTDQQASMEDIWKKLEKE